MGVVRVNPLGCDLNVTVNRSSDIASVGRQILTVCGIHGFAVAADKADFRLALRIQTAPDGQVYFVSLCLVLPLPLVASQFDAAE